MNPFDGGDDDPMAVAFDDLLNCAVDDSERVFEPPRARGELPPSRAFIASRPVNSATSGESLRQILVAPTEDVDAVVALPLNDGPRRRLAIDADEHGRRIERKRDRRSGGKARSDFSRT